MITRDLMLSFPLVVITKIGFGSRWNQFLWRFGDGGTGLTKICHEPEAGRQGPFIAFQWDAWLTSKGAVKLTFPIKNPKATPQTCLFLAYSIRGFVMGCWVWPTSWEPQDVLGLHSTPSKGHTHKFIVFLQNAPRNSLRLWGEAELQCSSSMPHSSGAAGRCFIPFPVAPRSYKPFC